MNFGGLVKKPVFIGSAIVIFLLLLFLLNRGSPGRGGETQYVSTGPSDAQLGAQTSLALAQIKAGQAAGQTAAQVAIARKQIAGDLEKGQVEADLTRSLATRQADND